MEYRLRTRTQLVERGLWRGRMEVNRLAFLRGAITESGRSVKMKS